MKSICFFNNKGGVGKTTLVCNVASYLATKFQLNVLLIDADPQCNATQLVATDKQIQEFYRERTRRRVKRDPTSTSVDTIFDVLGPIAAGDPDIAQELHPLRSSKNDFRVDLLPGHPQMSLLEDRLSQAWLLFVGGELGSARVTNWNTQLLHLVHDRYDLVFFDVGPSLGALNRSVLIGADMFVTPLGCDIFSLLGVTNIAQWLKEWLESYEQALTKVQQKWDIDEYEVRTETTSIARFIGYTVQQYITKAKAGVRRATKAYEQILKRTPKTVKDALGPFTAEHLGSDDLRLPDVPHMYSLVPLAQNAKVPIHLVESRHGMAGAQYLQKEQYVTFIHELAGAVRDNAGLGE